MHNGQHADKEHLIKDDNKENQTSTCIQSRYVIAVMAAVGLGTVMCQRASFSIAFVAMVNFTDIDEQQNRSDQCPAIEDGTNSSSPARLKEGEFNWDGGVRSNLLASFFYGYICLQMVGGYIGERYSLKYMMGLNVLLPSVINLLVPLLARWNVTALMVARVLAGLTTGPIFPCNGAVWGRWAPLTQRTTLATLTNMGGNSGVMIGTPLSGVLCDSDFLGGWPSVFYIFGICGCIWFVAWIFVMYETPAKHPRISTEERNLIESSLRTTGDAKYVPLPWFSLLKSRPVWVTNFAYLCDNIGFNVAFSCYPLYLREVLKFDVQWNGTIMSFVFLANITLAILSGFLADWIRKNTRLSITTIRKIFTLAGHGGAAVSCIGVSLVDCDRIAAVAFMIAITGLQGISVSGFGVNPIDLAPRYAGTLTGMANGLANLGGFLAPLLVNLITHGSANKTDWQHAFFMTAGIFGLNCVVYVLFASATEQTWANPKDSDVINEIDIQEEKPNAQT